MTDLKKVKEDMYKVVNLKLEESRDEFEATYRESLDLAKVGHPNLQGDDLENKTLQILKNKYMKKLKSAGKTFIGYVTGYSDASDTNSFLMKGAAQAIKDDKIAQFEKKNNCRISPDGKVMKSTKDGKEFEVKPRFQRTVYGFCKLPDSGQITKFTMYWQFDSLESAKRPEKVHVPVRFRGIAGETTENHMVINSVKETEFNVIQGSVDIPSYEELLVKFYKESLVTPSKLDKSQENTEILLYSEARYDPNPTYGDRFYIQSDENNLSLDVDSDEIIVQISKDFPMAQVEGFTDKTLVKCCFIGQYRPYTSKDGKLVKKIQAFGVYVQKEDRVTLPTETQEQESGKSRW